MTFINGNMLSNSGSLNFKTVGSDDLEGFLLLYLLDHHLGMLTHGCSEIVTTLFNLGMNLFFFCVCILLPLFFDQLTFRVFVDCFFWLCLHHVARRSEKLTASLANE